MVKKQIQIKFNVEVKLLLYNQIITIISTGNSIEETRSTIYKQLQGLDIEIISIYPEQKKD